MRKSMDSDFERCTSGIEFEEWVKELLGQLQMKADRVGKNDCGIDIIATAAINKDMTKQFYIQCKYYNKPLGKGPIQEIFAGTAHHKDYGEPVVITNNYVTFEARRYAKDLAVEIIAAPEWEEFKHINIEGRVDNPNQHTGLFGLMIAVLLKDKNYFGKVITSTEGKKITDKNELKLQIISEFDEAEECVKEAAQLHQRAAQFQQRALDIQKRALLRNITYD